MSCVRDNLLLQSSPGVVHTGSNQSSKGDKTVDKGLRGSLYSVNFEQGGFSLCLPCLKISAECALMLSSPPVPPAGVGSQGLILGDAYIWGHTLANWSQPRRGKTQASSGDVVTRQRGDS